MELKEFKKGLFVVKMDEKAKITPSEVEKNVAGFDLKKVEVTLAGSVTDDVVFSANGSGMKLELRNPEKSKEDVLAKVKELNQGKASLRVSGVLREVKVEGQKEPKLVLDLSAVELVGSDKKEK